jgi:O-antigen ligase
MAKAKAKHKRSIPPKIPHPYPHPRWAPLNSVWFASSLIGIIISTLYVSKYSLPWATAFTVVFITMLIAGFVSMRRATPDEQLQALPHANPKKAR